MKRGVQQIAVKKHSSFILGGRLTLIKAWKRKFYGENVPNTRKDDVRQWWRTVNAMSGRTYSQSCFTLERDGVGLSEGELAQSLNQYFATVTADIPPLDTLCLL